MSVSVEPPLHFNQQTATPTFSSPPQSPTHHIHAPLPPPTSARPSASLAGTDADMNNPETTVQPAGQRHDREDSEMQDGDLPDGQLLAHGASIQQSTNGVSNHEGDAPTAVVAEATGVYMDVMDTTPDINTHDAVQSGTIVPPESLSVGADSGQNEAGATAGQTVVDSTSPAVQAADAIPPTDLPQADAATTVDTMLQPQPPPPPPPVELVRSSDESESDDEDGIRPWHPIQEDTSSPDDDELKEILASTEHSALDHEYWESQAFLPLEEPEYVAGATGRIEWNIDAYNGTREKPNREVVMKSDPVFVGGHQWQIKFYPRGNDSDYLSVYLECLSVMEAKDSEVEKGTMQESVVNDMGQKAEHSVQESLDESKPVDAMAAGRHIGPERIAQTNQSDMQHTPLPLLGSKAIPKRKCVAAQVSVVLYNPSEPRVNFSKTALHRFCSGSPDWGWTRFHGPYYDIAHRMRGQRQALLRNDKLSLTAYIRVVDDETGCLWEHHSRENPWDSFAMTGLQGLMLGENVSAPGGNMISAIASWMLFKPFRQLLYNINVPDPESQPFLHPKPLIGALQKVLYMLRTQVEPGAGPVALDDVLGALEWYAMHDGLDKLDVIEVWEVLRVKLEEELQDTPYADTLQTLFGCKRDYSLPNPNYRVPVVDTASIQEGINKSTNFTVPGQGLPQLLTVELDRQVFDFKTRSYLKLINKVTLDENITVDGTSYTLFGFVVHKQTLQSYVYQPILRPEGPGRRWYSYSDSKEENQVKCLAKRQAIDAHEGRPGVGQVAGNDAVAYIAIYVRDDVASTTFTANADPEEWDVPTWLKNDADKHSELDKDVTASLPLIHENSIKAESMKGGSLDQNQAQEIEFKVVRSEVFQNHEGPGIFDAYEARWSDEKSSLTQTVRFLDSDSCEQIREKLAEKLDGIRDVRQIRFWFLDPIQGSHSRPNLLSTGKIEFSCGEYSSYLEGRDWTLAEFRRACRAIWVHVIDFDKLPELPKKIEQQEDETNRLSGEQSTMDGLQRGIQNDAQTDNSSSTQVPQTSEDTPMSEPDETNAESSIPQPMSIPEQSLEPAAGNTQLSDTAMMESQPTPAIDSTTIGSTSQDATVLPDAEMSGTQGDVLLPPPPPPPSGLIQAESLQPPTEAIGLEQPPDEIYFFLKFWDPTMQALQSRGSHIVARTARVDETIVSLLGLPMDDKRKIDIWEEEELTSVRAVKHRRTFAQLNIRNTAILLAAYPSSAEQRNSLAERAAFADIQAFLSFRAFARNLKHKVNGHFVYHYFSSEHYKGEITNGQRHGHGNCIYHSGANYEGTFRLGKRHGHGLHTFQNGDTYDGDWVDDQQHGSGTFVEATTGNTYAGGWKNDKKFGEGVTHWKNAQEAERMCRICWDEPAEAAFYDCGHVVACLTCAREVQTCPVCRKRVLSAMKLYYVA